MPSVESIGLGGGSLVHVGTHEQVLVGPDSVGHDLLTKALCFGGSIPTATDIAVLSGAEVGTGKVDLPKSTVMKAAARMRKMLESVIDRTKLSPDPCTVILVGGGSILCPTELNGVNKIVLPEHAGVANAIGAAIAKIFGSAELTVNRSEVQSGLAKVLERAVQNAISKGGDASSVTVLHEEVVGVPYTDGQTTIKIEIACSANHRKVFKEMISTEYSVEVSDETFEETKKHEIVLKDEKIAEEITDLKQYRPLVDADGQWHVSEIDLRFMSIGCYILGCGGGGSPYEAYLNLRHILSEGETIKIIRFEDLKDEDVCPPVASIGTPAVSIERPGGDLVLHALQTMSKELNVDFDIMLATEIGGGNGLGTLIWGSSRNYGIPTVDGDLMGKSGRDTGIVDWLDQNANNSK